MNGCDFCYFRLRMLERNRAVMKQLDVLEKVLAHELGSGYSEEYREERNGNGEDGEDHSDDDSAEPSSPLKLLSFSSSPREKPQTLVQMAESGTAVAAVAPPIASKWQEPVQPPAGQPSP